MDPEKEITNIKTKCARRSTDIQQEKPDLYDKLVQTIEEEKRDLSYEERLIRQLGVSNGERAKYIYNTAESMKTKKEKNDYIKELRKKKIVTDRVYKQIKYLIDNGGVIAE